MGYIKVIITFFVAFAVGYSALIFARGLAATLGGF